MSTQLRWAEVAAFLSGKGFADLSHTGDDGKVVRAFALDCKGVPSDIDEDKRELTVTISTDAKDRMGDIVKPGGALLENFLMNPIVLFGHDHRQPIGTALWTKKKGKAIIARVRFASPGQSPGPLLQLADDVFKLYQQGILRAWSIGFIPTEYLEMKEDGEYGFSIEEWELLEFSAVAVPANPEALTGPAKGVTSSLLRKALALPEIVHVPVLREKGGFGSIEAYKYDDGRIETCEGTVIGDAQKASNGIIVPEAMRAALAKTLGLPDGEDPNRAAKQVAARRLMDEMAPGCGFPGGWPEDVVCFNMNILSAHGLAGWPDKPDRKAMAKHGLSIDDNGVVRHAFSATTGDVKGQPGCRACELREQGASEWDTIRNHLEPVELLEPDGDGAPAELPAAVELSDAEAATKRHDELTSLLRQIVAVCDAFKDGLSGTIGPPDPEPEPEQELTAGQRLTTKLLDHANGNAEPEVSGETLEMPGDDAGTGASAKDTGGLSWLTDRLTLEGDDGVSDE